MKKLGFGLMRLPRKDNEFDYEKVCDLVDKFIDNGFTYFDTAYVYDGSEDIFRRTIAERYPRNAYQLADKLPCWHIKFKDDVPVIFNTSLKRCNLDYFDYYLIHSLQNNRAHEYDLYDCWDFCNEMKKEGKIKNFGFSFHGTPDLLEKTLEAHPEVDFVQLQINYLDWESDTVFSRKNYEICRQHDKKIIVMEPVKGGLLADVPDMAAKKLRKIDQSASFSSLALRFAASLDGVMMVLSGMSTIEQVIDNINTFDNFVPLNDEEIKIILEASEIINTSPAIACTSCKYCIENCPKLISIPDVFGAYNNMYRNGMWSAKEQYKKFIDDKASAPAAECISCRRCESVCPQHLSISEQLEKISKIFDNR